MKEVVNATDAAKIIGCPAKDVRFYMEKKVWNFGQVIPKKVTGKQVKKYLVNVRDMCAYFGIPLEEAERRLTGDGQV